MTVREILRLITPDIKEVHIVSGLNKHMIFNDYLNIIKAIHSRYPALHIKAYTAVEIDFFSRISGLSVREVLAQLKRAGVSCLPGGGAEIFSPRVRRLLCPAKIGWTQWAAVHREAHKIGLKSNATMLYGHLETLSERVDHLDKLRSLQDVSGGFVSFIPLAFHPIPGLTPPSALTALDHLRAVAVSRLYLDNFDHIKSYWVAVGETTSSVALHFGADDLDGTIGKERVYHAARATTPVGLVRDQMVRLIRSAGFVPVERNGCYRPVKGWRSP